MVKEEEGSLVFLDLETTGLPEEMGAASVQVTELALLALSRVAFLNNTTRALDKLRVCFQPRVPVSLQAASITGLDNFVLEHHPKFSSHSSRLIYNFLGHLEQPVWLVAHNGLHFDFRVLRAELTRTHFQSDNSSPSLEIYCVDTLPAFRHILENPNKTRELDLIRADLEEIQRNYSAIDQDTSFGEDEEDLMEMPPSKRSLFTLGTSEATPPRGGGSSKQQQTNVGIERPSSQPLEKKILYNLGSLYEHFFNGESFDSHSAEEDCKALMLICLQVKEQFLQWVDNNSHSLSSITPLADVQ